jgi:tRNA(Ile)-lysidine synthase
MVNIEENFIFNNNDRIVVGCSGGPDSMALLDMLLKIRDKYHLFIVVATVNYNVRKESVEEFNYVKKYCENNDLMFESKSVSNYSNENFEFEARVIRYRFFKELVKKYNLNYIMVAHHCDDLIETIMMKIVRGSNLKGYSGFKKIVDFKDFKIVRPLIGFTKDELIKYCNNNNIKYYVDSSNDNTEYTRNRFRKVLLPFFKEENNEVHKKFLKFSNTLNDTYNYVSRERDKALDRCYKDNSILIDKFLLEDEFIQKEILYYLLSELYDNDLYLVYDKHIELIMNLINSNKANSSINIPDGYIVNKNYNKISFEKNKNSKNYLYEFNDYIELNNGHSIKKVDSVDNNSNYICRLDSNEIKLPIIVRNRRDGDRISIKNMNGSKKLKDLFIDRKIELSERDEWPIVSDSDNNILWVPGITKSKFDKNDNDRYDIILKYQ